MGKSRVARSWWCSADKTPSQATTSAGKAKKGKQQLGEDVTPRQELPPCRQQHGPTNKAGRDRRKACYRKKARGKPQELKMWASSDGTDASESGTTPGHASASTDLPISASAPGASAEQRARAEISKRLLHAALGGTGWCLVAAAAGVPHETAGVEDSGAERIAPLIGCIAEVLCGQGVEPRERAVLWCLDLAMDAAGVGDRLCTDVVRSAVRLPAARLCSLDAPSLGKGRGKLLIPKNLEAAIKTDLHRFIDCSAIELEASLEKEVGEILSAGGWPKHFCRDESQQGFLVAAWLRMKASDGLREKLNFGHAIAIVRFSHTERRDSSSPPLLGKRDGNLVPYKDSHEFERLSNARACRPTGVNIGERYVHTWPHLRSCLRTLVLESDGKSGLAVSKLKERFRKRFAAECSETAFGHISLTELLRDENMHDVFALKEGPDGSMELQLDPTHVWRAAAGESFETFSGEVRTSQAPSTRAPRGGAQPTQSNQRPTAVDKNLGRTQERAPQQLPPWCFVRRTFIEVQPRLIYSTACTKQRPHSSPPRSGCDSR